MRITPQGRGYGFGYGNAMAYPNGTFLIEDVVRRSGEITLEQIPLEWQKKVQEQMVEA